MLAIALIALAVMWAFYNFLLKDKIKQLSQSRELLSSIEKEINIIIPKDILTGKSGSTNQIIEQKLKETSKKLPSEIDIPYLMQDFISSSSSGLKLNYDLVQPSPLISEQKYKRLPISIALSCDFSNLNLYLMRLESLPMMVRIDQIDISKDAGTKLLSARLMVSAFVMPSAGGPPLREKIVMPNVPKFDPFFSERASSGSSQEFSASKSPARKKKKASLLKFKGVFKGKETSAFLNDQIVKVGESVNDFMVVKITDKSIVVSKSGKRYTIRLGGEI